MQSLVLTDIVSGWTECLALALDPLRLLDEIRATQPVLADLASGRTAPISVRDRNADLAELRVQRSFWRVISLDDCISQAFLLCLCEDRDKRAGAPELPALSAIDNNQPFTGRTLVHVEGHAMPDEHRHRAVLKPNQPRLCCATLCGRQGMRAVT